MNNDKQPIIPPSIKMYLNEISERLWSGHAAVMVGSGFSKNAKRITFAPKPFPDWNQLGNLFYGKIHGRKPSSTENYLNVLKLADEVQAAFGRSALEQLIRTNIPDKEHEPSRLHIRLLDLPWTDVFTTNYDTLLERACASVTSQKYDIVVNKEDLVYSEKPRIIKLHGSFPFERPFVITEEDYRKYPKEFAPFVNTVQQALLENTLCLIGFSGADPNFLQWIGWIRDNLGKENSPKIFLIGIFNLSAAQKKLLEQRNIVLIDLSICRSVENDQIKALNLFCDYLRSKEEDGNKLEWPGVQKSLHPDPQTSDPVQKFTEILTEWKRTRLSYPAWVVLPENSRSSLWLFTKEWLFSLSWIFDLPFPLDIELLYELNWRLERCLFPILNNLVDKYEKILGMYNPLPDVLGVGSAKILKGKTEHDKIKWDEIENKWLELHLSLLRFYREEGSFKKWNALYEMFEKLYSRLSPQLIARLHFERTMFAFFSLNLPNIRKQLAVWPINETLPFWEAKRASLLAEIGEMEKAEKILENSLSFIRSQLNLVVVTNDYALVSQESYVMLLHRFIKDEIYFNSFDNKETQVSQEELELIKKEYEYEEYYNQKVNTLKTKMDKTVKRESIDSFENDWQELYNNRNGKKKQKWLEYLRKAKESIRKRYIQQFTKRWNTLKQYKCDPWNELKLFEIILEQEPSYTPIVSEKNEFDIGRITRTHHFGGMDKEAINAYTFLRFCEEIGIPFRISGTTIGKESAAGALTRISNYSPYWAFATLFRIGDSNKVNLIFNRESIYKMDIREIDDLIDNYLLVLKKCQSDIVGGDSFYADNFGVSLAQIIPEVLSRLCCKCSDHTKDKLLDFLLKVYSSEQRHKYKGIANLTKRLIAAYTYSQQYEIIPELLKFSILGNIDDFSADEFPNPFMFLEIYGPMVSKDKNLTISDNIILELLNKAESDNAGERRWAVFILVKLYKVGILQEEMIENFAKVLWAQTDEFGFPANTNFYKFAFLGLPHPSDIDPKSLFKKYLPSKILTLSNRQGGSIAITGGHVPVFDEIRGSDKYISWSQKEILDIFNRLAEWWDLDKHYLKKEEKSNSFFSIPEEIKARFINLIDILTNVIFPRLNSHINQRVKRSLNKLFEEFSEYGMAGLQAEAACIHIFPERKKELYSRIEEAISSNLDEEVIDALEAIWKILKTTRNGRPSTEIANLVAILAQQIKWRRKSGLFKSMNIVTKIVKGAPELLYSELQSDVLIGLGYLLKETDLGFQQKEFEVSDQLTFRKGAAHLSYTLYKFFTGKGEQIPEVISKWERICSSENEFAEIRKQWLEIIDER